MAVLTRLDRPLDRARCRRALADEAHLVCLEGGPGRPALLAWGSEPHPIHDLADVPEPTDGHAELAEGWPQAVTGGAILQLDYECPVGPWAANGRRSSTPRGWWWPLERFVSWDADGRAQVVGCGADELLTRLDTDQPRSPPLPPLAAPRPAWDETGHIARVDAIRAAIARGDCYQANLTLPWTSVGPVPPGTDLALHEGLCAEHPGRYGALLRRPGASVVSHSPECYLISDGRRCSSEPIKGTRARDPEGRGRAELLAASKDRAELAMIVDLVRNDLGRVARRGGVRVPEPELVLDLGYVHHLAARVTADLRPGTGIRDLLAATFPAGSITGAPKIAAMHLLRELESGPRGAYCGAIGWLGAKGACTLSVAIRTLVVHPERITLHAGGGIVADSDGAAEWAEALAKSGPMRARLNA